MLQLDDDRRTKNSRPKFTLNKQQKQQEAVIQSMAEKPTKKSLSYAAAASSTTGSSGMHPVLTSSSTKPKDTVPASGSGSSSLSSRFRQNDDELLPTPKSFPLDDKDAWPKYNASLSINKQVAGTTTVAANSGPKGSFENKQDTISTAENAPVVQFQQHIVQEGEDIVDLAVKYGCTEHEIRRFNRRVVFDKLDNVLGDTLYIPIKEGQVVINDTLVNNEEQRRLQNERAELNKKFFGVQEFMRAISTASEQEAQFYLEENGYVVRVAVQKYQEDVAWQKQQEAFEKLKVQSAPILSTTDSSSSSALPCPPLKALFSSVVSSSSRETYGNVPSSDTSAVRGSSQKSSGDYSSYYRVSSQVTDTPPYSVELLPMSSRSATGNSGIRARHVVRGSSSGSFEPTSHTARVIPSAPPQSAVM